MKTLLYTGHDAAYSTLADITVPRMEQYAEKHGLYFKAYTQPLIDVPNGIYWTGVCGALKAFRDGYDSIMYLDCDQLITNYNPTWYPMAEGVHISKDWGADATDDEHFSACGFIAYKDSDSDRFFKSVKLMSGARKGGDFPEQHEMRSVYKHQKEYGHNWVNVLPRKIFNAVPDQIAPGNVPEPWSKGDFAAHLTMVSLERRIEIAKEILNEIV